MTSMKLLGVASVLALVGLAGCDQSDKPAPVAAAPAPPPLSASDTTFVNSVAQAGTEEVKFGQLAETQSRSKHVKSFAAQMVADHTAANQKLMSIAQAKGVTPATAPDAAHDQMYTQLQGEHGRKFDHDYLEGQIADHQTVVTLMQTEIQSGTDPDLKSFASSTLPIIQHHLEEAQALATPPATTMHHHHRHASS